MTPSASESLCLQASQPLTPFAEPLTWKLLYRYSSALDTRPSWFLTISNTYRYDMCWHLRLESGTALASVQISPWISRIKISTAASSRKRPPSWSKLAASIHYFGHSILSGEYHSTIVPNGLPRLSSGAAATRPTNFSQNNKRFPGQASRTCRGAKKGRRRRELLHMLRPMDEAKP